MALIKRLGHLAFLAVLAPLYTALIIFAAFVMVPLGLGMSLALGLLSALASPFTLYKTRSLTRTLASTLSLPLGIYLALGLPFTPVFAAVTLLSQFLSWPPLSLGGGEMFFNAAPFVDLYRFLVGAAAATAAGVILVRDFRWLHGLEMQVRRLPTSTARSAAPGLLELRGRYVPLPDPPPGVSRPIPPFILEDDTGRILVDDGPVRGFSQQFTSFWTGHGLTGQNHHCGPGSPIYVLGTAELNETAPESAVDSAALVIRRRTRTVRGFWSKFTTGIAMQLEEGGQSDDYRDVLFISNSDEAGARQLLSRAKFTSCRNLGAVIALTLSMALLTLPRLLPSESIVPASGERILAGKGIAERLTYIYLRHPEVGYRQFAVERIGEERFKGYLEAVLPDWIEDLEHRDKRVRSMVAASLYRLSPESLSSVRERLLAALDSRHEEVRFLGINMMRPENGIAAATALPRLERIADGDPRHGFFALRAALNYGRDAAHLAPIALDRLRDSKTNPWMQGELIGAIGRCGDAAVVPVREYLLRDPSPEARSLALRVLSLAFKDSREALLKEHLFLMRSRHVPWRLAGLQGVQGDENVPAPVLRELASLGQAGGDAYQADIAFASLSKLDKEYLKRMDLAALRRSLKAASRWQRDAALYEFKRREIRSSTLAKHAGNILWRPETKRNQAAYDYLEWLGPAAAPALPDILAYWDAVPIGERTGIAGELLAEIGPAARPALPRLRSLLNEVDARWKTEVLQVIQSIGEADEALSRDMLALVEKREGYDYIRHAAMRALGDAARPASVALEPIRRVAEDNGEDSTTRAIARDAFMALARRHAAETPPAPRPARPLLSLKFESETIPDPRLRLEENGRLEITREGGGPRARVDRTKPLWLKALPPLDLPASYTIEFRVRLPAIGVGYHTLLWTDTVTVALSDDKLLLFWIPTDYTFAYQNYRSVEPPRLEGGRWYRMAVVYDGDAVLWRLYVDGKLAGDAESYFTDRKKVFRARHRVEHFIFGRELEGGVSPYPMEVKDFRVLGYAKTAGEFQAEARSRTAK